MGAASIVILTVGEEQEQAAGQIVLLCIGQQILTGHNNNNIRIVEFLHFEIDTGICNYFLKAFKIINCTECVTIYINSLLPVSRYIDTAFADKGSHQKKKFTTKMSGHI